MMLSESTLCMVLVLQAAETVPCYLFTKISGLLATPPPPSPTQKHRLATEIRCHKRIYYGM